MSKTQEEIQAELDAAANATTTNTVTPATDVAEDQTKAQLKAEPSTDAKSDESGFGPLMTAKIKMVKPPFQFKADHKKCPLKWAQVIITDNGLEIFEFADKLQELTDSSQAPLVSYKLSNSSQKPFFEGFADERLTFSEKQQIVNDASINKQNALLTKMQELGMQVNFTS